MPAADLAESDLPNLPVIEPVIRHNRMLFSKQDFSPCEGSAMFHSIDRTLRRIEHVSHMQDVRLWRIPFKIVRSTEPG